MRFPFKFVLQFFAASSTPNSPANLSEAEVIARYPFVAEIFLALFALGIISDIYLLSRYLRHRQGEPAAAGQPRFQIPRPPWEMTDLVMSVAMLAGLLVAGNIVAFVALKLIHTAEDQVMLWALTADLLMRGVVLCGFIEFFRRRNIDWVQTFGLKQFTRAWKAVAQGTLAFFAVLPPLAIVFALYTSVGHLFGMKDEPQAIADLLATTDSRAVEWLIIGFAVVVAPLFEEFLFRGFAYPVLKQRWGAWPALLVVSAVFAIVHVHLPTLVPLFALAIGLGLAYELSGSLLAPMTMHALFNTANVAMLLYVRAHS